MENRIVKLGDVITANYGRTLPKKNRVSGKIPVYGSSGITDYHNRSIVDGPAVIIGRKGNIGSVFLTENSFYPIDTTYYVTREDLKGLDIYFTYYLLQCLPLQEMNTDSAVPGLNRNNLYSIPVKIPDLSTQVTIADILRTIDKKIQLNQQINNNLLKLSSSIVMRASLKSDRVINLQALLDNSRKPNISTDEISLDTYVSNTSLRANKRGLDTAEDYPSVKSVRAVDPGDILVGNIRPYFKKIWIADRKGGASNDVLTFRADSAVVTPEFLFGILYSDRFFDYVTATSKGTKMPRGDKQAIALYQVGLPDKDVIASVTDVVKPMLEQVSLNERQNQQLTKLRDLLLPKLLAGDINLSNIEAVMNNA
ncbi:hypothetical protein HC014_05150 [Limosilactobacillus fermentum]|uniref:restriction endonuclease subunit S n=1 Tax=Limosilactobacillus fermentum TaxID=1613 RepID=UPI0022E3C36A|nr:restriction endonuclease subunit S [Limosilactobacillus fermentum]